MKFENAVGALTFGGITQVERAIDGSYVVHYADPTLEGKSVSGLAFDLYLEPNVTPAMLASFSGATALSPSDYYAAQLATAPDGAGPAETGFIASSTTLQGVFHLDPSIDPTILIAGRTYAMQVAVTDGLKTRKLGPTILLLTETGVSFAGLQAATISGTDIVLTWPAADAKSAKGVVTYLIYQGSAFDTQIGATTATTFHVDASAMTVGSTVAFGVQAVDSRGIPDGNQVIKPVTVPPLPLTFAGLQQQNVILATDNSKITLSWTPATNVTGSVKYSVENFGQTLGASTAETHFELDAPKHGSTYVFLVRAFDDTGFDHNQNFVTVVVP